MRYVFVLYLVTIASGLHRFAMRFPIIEFLQSEQCASALCV